MSTPASNKNNDGDNDDDDDDEMLIAGVQRDPLQRRRSNSSDTYATIRLFVRHR